jgi:tetratricopeptide (TPR) repeat protein
MAGCLLCCALPAGAEGWPHPQWTYRRELKVADFKPTNLPGDDVATADFYAGGLCALDGGDIRVTDRTGKEVPSRVLMVGPGDRVRVAFGLRRGVNTYYAYFGCDKPGQPAKKLDIKRGVLLESRLHEGGIPKTLAQARKAIDNAKVLGSCFVDRPFLGHNPLGPQEKVANVYTGWLVCPVDGEYTFAGSSRNASFILVDDELVVDAGGGHGPWRDARRQGKVKLTAGVHKLSVLHVTNGGGEPIIVAAWQQPRARRIWPIAAQAFAPVHQAHAGPLERYGPTPAADILVDHAGEAFAANHYFQRFAFEAAVTAARAGQCRWDFGDGQTAEGATVEHVYLASGEYTVKLSVSTGAGVLERSWLVQVDRPWDRVTGNELDSLAEQAGIVARYDFSKADAASAAQAVSLLRRGGQDAVVLRLGKEFLTKSQAPPGAVEQVAGDYADALVAAGRSAEAVEAIEQASRMTNSPAALAAMRVRQGRLLLEELDSPQAARKVFADVLTRYSTRTTTPAIRLARIGLGDCWRADGDYDKAMEAYKEAGTGPRASRVAENILRGDYARQVEEYLRCDDLLAAAETLDEWEQTLPADRLDGYSSLLRVRLRLARRRPLSAVREARTLVKVNPRSSYAPRLLLVAAEALDELDRDDEARAMLQQIVSDYPESTLAAEAAGKLKAAQQ